MTLIQKTSDALADCLTELHAAKAALKKAEAAAWDSYTEIRVAEQEGENADAARRIYWDDKKAQDDAEQRVKRAEQRLKEVETAVDTGEEWLIGF